MVPSTGFRSGSPLWRGHFSVDFLGTFYFDSTIWLEETTGNNQVSPGIGGLVPCKLFNRTPRASSSSWPTCRGRASRRSCVPYVNLPLTVLYVESFPHTISSTQLSTKWGFGHQEDTVLLLYTISIVFWKRILLINDQIIRSADWYTVSRRRLRAGKTCVRKMEGWRFGGATTTWPNDLDPTFSRLEDGRSGMQQLSLGWWQ